MPPPHNSLATMLLICATVARLMGIRGGVIPRRSPDASGKRTGGLNVCRGARFARQAARRASVAALSATISALASSIRSYQMFKIELRTTGRSSVDATFI